MDRLHILVASCCLLGAAPVLPNDPTTPTRDFSKAEEGERYPGGTATHTKRPNKDAFSHASANMSFEREIDFKVGNGLFKRLWVTAPAPHPRGASTIRAGTTT